MTVVKLSPKDGCTMEVHVGGSIITSNVILTAAHCVVKGGALPEIVYVWLNSTKFFGVPALKAQKVVAHPRFLKYAEYVYDVALLKLGVDLEFNTVMKPVCLPEEDIDVAGKSLLLAGWGMTRESGDVSPTLLQARVRGMTDEACREKMKWSLNPRTREVMKPGPMVCVKGPTATACEVRRGDSGGPLTLKDYDGRYTQVGISSLSYECAADKVAMYARVAFHLDWIQKMLNRPGKWTKLQYDNEYHHLRPVRQN
ncbi:hypothetical protein MTO96_007858 [Rhipicephalus appendiculatus]